MNIRSLVRPAALSAIRLLLALVASPAGRGRAQPDGAAACQPLTSGLPGYAFVTSIVTAPATGGETILAGAYAPEGVYRSSDGGLTWQPASAGLDGAAVFSVVHEAGGRRILAATVADV